MGRVRETAERLWNGEESLHGEPWNMFAGLEELADGVAFVSSFCNVIAIATDAGLVVVDTGSPLTGAGTAHEIAAWCKASGRPFDVHSIVYTHGHIDHVSGVEPLTTSTRTQVIAHRALRDRFDRYVLTGGYNAAINQRQFRLPGLEWPRRFRYPDLVFDAQLELGVGGRRFALRHDRGETDDHVWVWIEDRKALCTGDLFIWASPNCGNPQKAQRYPREWAHALRAMAALGAELLLPGHGPPILGRERVARALDETARLLETLVEQTLHWMNEGAPLDVVLARVKAPEELLARPYLRPVYDEPEFIVRNLWRLYGGWWDGDPSTLKPAPKTALAEELAALSGGAKRLARRAMELSEIDEHRLACHLIELAALADSADAEVRALRARIYRARAQTESSLMARGVFHGAAEEGPNRGFE
ncbi:MAG: MBL fold metallo-hydrolase [Sandaracinaceae bacterium]|nr:MBL fold metallo-hydrolase [Sandaracinaceae bacterium]